MAQMKTYWKRKALAKYKSITLWYKKKMGLSAANKFVQGINDVVVLLEQNPHLGKEKPELKAYKRNYRSFVEHRNHKIIYYIEKTPSTLPISGQTAKTPKTLTND